MVLSIIYTYYILYFIIFDCNICKYFFINNSSNIRLFFIYTLIPLFPLSIRRLHDTERSGCYLLLNFITFEGIILFIFFCKDSTPYLNIYGPSNKYIISNLVPLEDQINLVPQGNVAYTVVYPQGNVVYPQGNILYPQGNLIYNQGNDVSQGNFVNVIQPGNIFIQNPQNNIVYSNQDNNPIINQNNINVSPGNVDYTPHV